MRFSSQQRLLSASDYKRVFDAPERKSGQSELLVLARSNAFGCHRLGLAIAKKHVPLAVKRNSIKRLTREHFRRLDTGHTLATNSADTIEGDRKTCFDIVVLSRKGANKATRRDIHRALDRQFHRIGLVSTAP